MPEANPSQPYPGLRPFDFDEALLFHGRETHTAELLRRLSENRFLAVVGSWGAASRRWFGQVCCRRCIGAGLLASTSRWRVCVMRPGSAPMDNLAQALAQQGALSAGQVARSSFGLVKAARDSGLQDGENLLVVVSQFTKSCSAMRGSVVKRTATPRPGCLSPRCSKPRRRSARPCTSC